MPENRGCGGFGFGDDCCWIIIPEVTEEDVANPLALLVKKRSERHFSFFSCYPIKGNYFLFSSYFILSPYRFTFWVVVFSNSLSLIINPFICL